MKELIFALAIAGIVFTEALVCPSGNRGTVQLPGKCPKISFIKNPNINQTAGLFYRPFSSLDLRPVGCTGNCITVSLLPKDSKSNKVDICCQKPCSNFCGTDVGSGVLSENCKNPDAFDYVVGGTVFPVHVLDTDTNNYWIYYYCDSPPEGPRTDVIYVLTRDQILTQVLRDHIFKVVRDNDIDASKILESTQGDSCGYSWSS